MSVRSLTFERQSTTPIGDIYDITTPIPNGNIVLSSARVDFLLATPTDYSSIPKSISLEIGTIIGNEFVVDNDPTANYFKVILNMNLVTVGANTYLSSVTTPNTSFKMSGDLQRRCVFRIRSNTGAIVSPDFFSFHFTALSP